MFMRSSRKNNNMELYFHFSLINSIGSICKVALRESSGDDDGAGDQDDKGNHYRLLAGILFSEAGVSLETLNNSD